MKLLLAILFSQIILAQEAIKGSISEVSSCVVTSTGQLLTSIAPEDDVVDCGVACYWRRHATRTTRGALQQHQCTSTRKIE